MATLVSPSTPAPIPRYIGTCVRAKSRAPNMPGGAPSAEFPRCLPQSCNTVDGPSANCSILQGVRGA
eukprot:12583164-Alexandrium_andersonii.AAC.1